MLTAYNEYRNRVNFKGKTKREYVNKKVNESIDSLINDSQYGFTIEKDGKEYEVAILSTSSTQDYERANIIASNEVGLDRGSLFKWNGEFWIVLQKMFRPEQPGFNGYAYRCKGSLKWIDEHGVLNDKPGYISSGRVTNSLTYTPNSDKKFDNLFLHDNDWSMIAAIQQDLTLHDDMRFIIKGQAYRVTNIDNVSIDNVSIVSLVDDKLLDSDDKVNGIANLYDSSYELRSDVQDYINLYSGDIKSLPVSVICNGNIVNEDITCTCDDNNVIRIEGNKIIGLHEGRSVVHCMLAKNNYISLDINVEVSDQHIQDTVQDYIDGPDYIEWNQSAIFKMSNNENATFEIEWQTNIKHSEPIIDSNSITISIKDKYAGNIVIRASQNGKQYEKNIVIKTI